MNFRLKTAAAALLAVSFVASYGQASETKPPVKKHHMATKRARAKKVPAATVEEQIQTLRLELKSQIDNLKTDLSEKDAQLKQAQLTAAEAQAEAAKAEAATSAQQQAASENTAAVGTLQATVTDLKANQASLATTVSEETTQIKKEIKNPDFIHYKGVKLTPGGYAQFATIWRAHNANMDTADNYGQYAFANSPDYYQSEFRASGRASRLSLKAEGAAKGMKFMGYTEIDFLASAGGNETQSNSFSPRLRLAFANVDLPGGWSIAGGQNWTMLQTTRKGINPLSEWLPSVIDNSYTPGFSYAREGTIRVVKQITPQAWFGFSVENPDTVVGGGCAGKVVTGATTAAANCSFTTGAIQGLANSSNTTSPNSGFLNALSGTSAVTGNPSTNYAPDLVAKIAFEPGWGHYEVKAIGRFFRDRVYPNFLTPLAPTVTTVVTCTTATPPVCTASSTTTANISSSTVGANNKLTEGGAFGFGAILPFVKDKLDLDLQGLAGAGIGRFSTTSGPDVTYKPNGSLEPVRSIQAVAGIETHPTPKLDFNIYAGEDYYQRTSYFLPATTPFFGTTVATGGAQVGYGYTDNSDTGCSTEGSYSSTNSLSTSCSGVTKSVMAAQSQAWYRLFKGREGTVQFGASYAYVSREAWRGYTSTTAPTPAALAAGTATAPYTPKTINQIVMTSLRYYFP